MKLSLLLTALTSVVYTTSAYSDFEFSALIKRDHGLPYSTLPSTSCTAPTACQKITQPATCRCSNELTTCQNSKGQFCWGSSSLNMTSCPSIPTACASSFSGTQPNCLCNSQKMLCVDNQNNYCYATITGTGSSAVASVAALPYAAPSASSSSAVAGSASASGAAISSATIANPSASNGGISANPTVATSGAELLASKFWVTAGFAGLASIVFH